jgi:predicted branched-subunit amino acid permease
LDPFPSPEARAEFLAGLRETLPLLAGAVPFGFVTGVASVAAGMSAFQAIALSFICFSGIAQLVTAQLLAAGSPLVVILAAALVLSLRHLMYSAAFSPHIAHLPPRWRIAMSYLLTDQGFAMGVRRFSEPGPTTNREWHYLGTSVPLWFTWQAAVVAGAVAGAQVPPSWSLDFVVVLSFVSILAPALRTRADIAAAVVGGAVALIAAGLPWRLALVAGSLAGIGAGVIYERAKAR